jgi:hypothetical protein
VNLFVVGWSDARPVEAAEARRKLAAVLERLPFFAGQEIQRWTSPSKRSAAAWITHSSQQTGGITYHRATPAGIELWSGHRAGRFASVTATDDGLTTDQDPMGSYPLYGSGGWVSNNPTVLRTGDDLEPAVLASLLAGGWSLSGDPLWTGVTRTDGILSPAEVVPLLGRGLDARAAADDLTDVTRALMDWPGRPSVVPVTAGRDSRLVLAAAVNTGLPFTTNTGGRPGEPDVDVGRQLAQIAGVDHSLIADDPYGSLHEHWRRAAELLELTAGGTASLADAVGFPHGPRDGPLPLWHSGQGGEIARGYYARVRGRTPAALTDSLYAAFAMRRPGRREPLNQEGEALVRDQIAAWVEETLQAGAQPEDVPDLFYLFKRMGTWAGPTHGAVEYVRDTTSPLWHRRMLPHLLGLPAKDRAAERFHHEVLNHLSPDLARAPGWFTPTTPLQRKINRARHVANKAVAELRTRRARSTPLPSQGVNADPFAPVLEDLRGTVLSDTTHPAWTVLDRQRTEQLLTQPAPDEVNRYYAWRLATVFGTA